MNLIKRFLLPAGIISICIIAGLAASSRPDSIAIFLPGTQPGSVDTIPAGGVTICKQCHYSTSSIRPVMVWKEWSGSMMAHAARDPIFYSALAIANKYASITGNGAGEYCIRCHSPSGWLAGRSEDISGHSLTGTDFDGVQCDYCHRLVDPVNPDSSISPLTFPVPGYGNGMHVMQRTSEPKRGPFDSLSAPHETKYDQFQTKSEMCGVCHEVSNPLHTQGQDRIFKSPHEYAPIERTYSEWLMSWYATQGDSGTCQSCHMSKTTGYFCVYSSSPAQTIATHDLTGGNTFVPDILPDFWPGLDTSALSAGKQRATLMLQRAAELDVNAFRLGDTVYANVRITNLTGHKLPTGYPDGRRMWIQIVGTSATGDTIFQSGEYHQDSAILVHDDQIKVYEALPGITDSTANVYGVQPGPSFHFILNDTIFFDNRIPPKGFTNAGFSSRLASPVGVTYPDSQYWDDTHYILPKEVTSVSAILYYQTISREYIEFLREHNIGNFYDWNNWGDKLYNSWEARGKSRPVAMEMQSVAVADSPSAVSENGGLPAKIHLFQNFPNPFNPITNFEFRIPASSAGRSNFEFVSLKIYDMLGKEIAFIVNKNLPPGNHTISWNAGGLPSGIYFYKLTVGKFTETKKMVLMK